MLMYRSLIKFLLSSFHIQCCILFQSRMQYNLSLHCWKVFFFARIFHEQVAFFAIAYIMQWFLLVCLLASIWGKYLPPLSNFSVCTSDIFYGIFVSNFFYDVISVYTILCKITPIFAIFVYISLKMVESTNAITNIFRWFFFYPHQRRWNSAALYLNERNNGTIEVTENICIFFTKYEI